MTKHLRLFRIVAGFLFSVSLLTITAWGQQTAETPAPVPVPSQITSAKKIFISNAGLDGDYSDPDIYNGGPNRAYNQFYGAMKVWGQYEMVSAPADADLIFEVGQINRSAAGALFRELKVRIIDPKTNITLWVLTNYLSTAGLAKTREKNYDLAMTTLVNDLKIVATPAPSPAANK
jgi:hypothetical protein